MKKSAGRGGRGESKRDLTHFRFDTPRRRPFTTLLAVLVVIFFKFQKNNLLIRATQLVDFLNIYVVFPTKSSLKRYENCLFDEIEFLSNFRPIAIYASLFTFTKSLNCPQAYQVY